MSKIFRLHTGASEVVEHWQEAQGHLSDNYINTIDDPSGSNASTQITSIPTPFARMDLVRTAFRFVSSKRQLDGSSIYHRIVSDMWDIAQIFFNIDALGDKIELISWGSGMTRQGGSVSVHQGSELGQLISSSNPKHKLLGDTLRMYLVRDAIAFNFSDFENCYLLNYKNGPELINVIGGTSPATLFFSSANDLSFIQDIPFGNHKVFDSNFCPLYKRQKDFIVFIFSLRKSIQTFSEYFPDINTYLDLTFQLLDESTQNEIRQLNQDSYSSNYDTISVGAEGNNAEILGFLLRTKKRNSPAPGGNGFIIEASRGGHAMLPCVLPMEIFNEPINYVGGAWQPDYYKKVPFYDERKLQDRTLPNQDYIKYPYLTVSDLLEPYLIRLPFPIDSDKFFNGNYEILREIDGHSSFLLPVKKLYFDYFSPEDLMGSVGDGKKRIELKQMPDGIKVILRIPIKNNKYVQLSRLYHTNQFKDRIQPADEKQNYGVIVDHQFTLCIYPFLKLTNDNPHYRIMLVDRNLHFGNKGDDYSLSFYGDTSRALPVTAIKKRSSKEQIQGVTTAYHIVENNFEYVEVGFQSARGLVIPLFKPLPPPSHKFKFAIDLGTTNTHIEYRVDEQHAVPFDISSNDIQFAALHSPDEEKVKRAFAMNASRNLDGFMLKLIEVVKEEFIPYIIGPDLQHRFPQRTVVGDNGSFNHNDPTFALADFNIPFWYLKEDDRIHSETTPNLKWVDFKNDPKLERRIRGFIEQLFLMIRNKVLLNGGDLNKTEVTWFYPTSMPVFRRNFLEKCWTEHFATYISKGKGLRKMSESFSPFYFYYHNEHVRPNERPAVNIDIGGGTTDIVVYQGDVPKLLTSFRFAANTIFGDGYGGNSTINGFVNGFGPRMLDALSNSKAARLRSIGENLQKKNASSVELIEFFFSIENNKLIRDNRIPLSFSKMLAEDNDYKIVFIFSFASIIYHIAKLMKIKGLEIPEYITFSGNGAKVVRLAAGGDDLSVLIKYTGLIFSDVYEVEKAPRIEFRLSENPKEMTCKGGLQLSDEDFEKFQEVESDISTVLIGTNDDSIDRLEYNSLNQTEVLDSVCMEVGMFIDKFFDWNSKLSYYQYFGVNPAHFDSYKELMKSKLKSDLIDGRDAKLKEVKNDKTEKVEETLFFYPLAGSVNRLARKIYEITSKKK